MKGKNPFGAVVRSVHFRARAFAPMKTRWLIVLALPACAPRHVPAVHRAAAETCSTNRPSFLPNPASMPDAAYGDLCTSDLQCSMPPPGGTNGRCGKAPWGGGDAIIPTSCSYDNCAADSDCKATGDAGVALCDCRAMPAHGDDSGGSARPNGCNSVGNCRLDSDCASTGFPFCSPSLYVVSAFQHPDYCSRNFVGYYCHTSDDECADDSDCATHACSYDVKKKHWVCSVGCPPVGP